MAFKTEINLKDFVPLHTFECGQCFRWDRQSDGSYIGVAGGRAVRICAFGEKVEIDNCTKDDYEGFWRAYLDAERDYGEIKKIVSVNDTMKEAVRYGGGIRILHQEFFEALISFIISQRSSIPKIRSCVKKMCELYGDEIDFEETKLYSFPTAETLAKVSEERLRELGVGYRAPYIADAARRVAEGSLIGAELEKMETPAAREKIMQVYGVGDKVCDCVLLFSLGKFDLFPSDVWIKRVMAEKFDAQDAKKAGESTFGMYSGFAQQYLFYWRKESEGRNKILK